MTLARSGRCDFASEKGKHRYGDLEMIFLNQNCILKTMYETESGNLDEGLKWVFWVFIIKSCRVRGGGDFRVNLL